MAGKGRTRRAGRAGQRRVTIALSLVAAIVVAAVVGYFAYRAAADLPGAVALHARLVDEGDFGNAGHRRNRLGAGRAAGNGAARGRLSCRSR